MHKLLLAVFISSMMLCSCSQKFDYISTTQRTINKKAKQLCKEDNLILLGSGGSMMDEITEISLMFETYRKVDIDEARRLCVRLVEELKDSVNNNESLKPYLKPYPFPSEGMKVSILFLDDDGGVVSYGCVYLGTGGVSSVSAHDSFVFYASFNPRTQLLESYCDEPYEEALSIVHNNLQNSHPIDLKNSSE